MHRRGEVFDARITGAEEIQCGGVGLEAKGEATARIGQDRIDGTLYVPRDVVQHHALMGHRQRVPPRDPDHSAFGAGRSMLGSGGRGDGVERQQEARRPVTA